MGLDGLELIPYRWGTKIPGGAKELPRHFCRNNLVLFPCFFSGDIFSVGFFCLGISQSLVCGWSLCWFLGFTLGESSDFSVLSTCMLKKTQQYDTNFLILTKK